MYATLLSMSRIHCSISLWYVLRNPRWLAATDRVLSSPSMPWWRHSSFVSIPRFPRSVAADFAISAVSWRRWLSYGPAGEAEHCKTHTGTPVRHPCSWSGSNGTPNADNSRRTGSLRSRNVRKQMEYSVDAQAHFHCPHFPRMFRSHILQVTGLSSCLVDFRLDHHRFPGRVVGHDSPHWVSYLQTCPEELGPYSGRDLR